MSFGESRANTKRRRSGFSGSRYSAANARRTGSSSRGRRTSATPRPSITSAASPSSTLSVARASLEATRNGLYPQTKAELGPFLEEMQRTMEMGRMLRQRDQ